MGLHFKLWLEQSRDDIILNPDREEFMHFFMNSTNINYSPLNKWSDSRPCVRLILTSENNVYIANGYEYIHIEMLTKIHAEFGDRSDVIIASTLELEDKNIRTLYALGKTNELGSYSNYIKLGLPTTRVSLI